MHKEPFILRIELGCAIYIPDTKFNRDTITEVTFDVGQFEGSQGWYPGGKYRVDVKTGHVDGSVELERSRMIRMLGSLHCIFETYYPSDTPERHLDKQVPTIDIAVTIDGRPVDTRHLAIPSLATLIIALGPFAKGWK